MSPGIEAYSFYEAIRSQPAELARLLTASEPVDLAAEVLGAARRVFCIGLGASWNAACVAADLLSRADVDARAWSSADFVQYPPVFSRDDAAIVFLHSAKEQRSRAVIESLGKKRSPIVLVIGAESASESGPLPIGTTVLRTGVRERSAMATVSQTAAILLTARVAAAISSASMGELAAVPEAVAAALRLETDIESLAHDWQAKRMFIALGAGPHQPAAHEAATMIALVAGRPAIGHAVDQFLHRPQAHIRNDDTFAAFASAGAGLGRTREAVASLRGLGCQGVWVSPEAAPDGALHLPVLDVGEALAPVVELVPAQLLAGHLAAIAGAEGAARAALDL